MRERINRLARGIIDNGSPELVLAPERWRRRFLRVRSSVARYW